MKSFEMVFFDKKNEQVLNMKLTLKKAIIGSEKEIAAHIRPIAASNAKGDQSYYVNWREDGVPYGYLVIR
jgi:hypothetical protein